MTWIILVITFESQIVGGIPFSDEISCEKAIPVIRNSIEHQWPGADLTCETTGDQQESIMGRDE